MFKCPECTKMFKTKQGLGSHRWRAHGAHGTKVHTSKKKKKEIAGIGFCPECGCNLQAYNAVHRMIRQ